MFASFKNGLDRVAGNIVRVLYLSGLVLGFFAFFSDIAVDNKELRIGVAGALAAALVLHEYLAQSRVRLLFSRLGRLKDGDNRRAVWLQFKVSIGVMVALIIFDMFNAVSYWCLVNLHVSLLPPLWEMVIRGVALSIFFFLSSLLVEIEDDASKVLASAEHRMLLKTMNAFAEQCNTRLDAARKQGIDLGVITAALLEDEGDGDAARRVRLIASGLTKTDGIRARDMRPNSGNLYLPSGQADSGGRGNETDYLNQTGKPTTKLSVVDAGRLRRHPVKRTPQERVVSYLNRHPEASINNIIEGARVSRESAVKFRDLWRNEQALEG
jgi:hypothetical protein